MEQKESSQGKIRRTWFWGFVKPAVMIQMLRKLQTQKSLENLIFCKYAPVLMYRTGAFLIMHYKIELYSFSDCVILSLGEVMRNDTVQEDT